jgi:hypothetical protein
MVLRVFKLLEVAKLNAVCIQFRSHCAIALMPMYESCYRPIDHM